jgi:hypothetical protein
MNGWLAGLSIRDIKWAQEIVRELVEGAARYCVVR